MVLEVEYSVGSAQYKLHGFFFMLSRPTMYDELSLVVNFLRKILTISHYNQFH